MARFDLLRTELSRDVISLGDAMYAPWDVLAHHVEYAIQGRGGVMIGSPVRWDCDCVCGGYVAIAWVSHSTMKADGPFLCLCPTAVVERDHVGEPIFTAMYADSVALFDQVPSRLSDKGNRLAAFMAHWLASGLRQRLQTMLTAGPPQ